MLNADTDLEKFGQKLVKVGREEVAWQKRKLQWILEQKKKAVEADEAD